MPQAGFELMIPVFEWSKTGRASDRAAIGTGIDVVSLIFLDLTKKSLNRPYYEVTALKYRRFPIFV